MDIKKCFHEILFIVGTIVLLLLFNVRIGMSNNDIKECKKFNEYKGASAFEFPFIGEWKILWGGCGKSDNLHHQTSISQKFAYDFVKIGKKGKIYKGNGVKLMDYYSYNEPVLSPDDGIVYGVVNGIEDSPLNNPNKYFIPGNMVTISHKGGVFSYLAHLKPSSILVQKGQKVKRGQIIGRCGNSGNSTIPHIHFQITNKSVFQNGIGLPITFINYSSNGEFIKVGKPIKGEIINIIK